MTKPDVAEYEFAPPLVAEEDGYQVSEVSVQEFDDGDCYDLFDQNGNCLNEGCPFFSIPTREQVVEFVTTGKIKGQYE